MHARNVLIHGLLLGYSILLVSAVPVDPEPTPVQPRDTTATPNPLDYAPDFSQDPFPPGQMLPTLTVLT
jgi:hypothetical protein